MKIDISQIEKQLIKIKKKDKILFEKLVIKINQISKLDYKEIQHFKNLKNNLKEFKRVHIGSFVLIFKVKDDTIYFVRFEHHDKAYK